MNGYWYIFAGEVIRTVEQFLSQIEVVSITPDTTRYNETEMNKALYSMSQDDYSFSVFDKTKINLPTSGYSRANIECCDYIEEGCNFVYIKFSDSSGKLSHLWKQGEVCASLIGGSDEFRKRFLDRLEAINVDLYKKIWNKDEMQFRMDPYIVFTIVSSKFRSCDDLFLFAKIALYTSIKAIEQNGFRVKFEYMPKDNALPV